MNDIRVEFGKNLRTMRKKLSWSQEKLGEKADLHPTYVSGIERGESNVSLEYIEKLASGLSLPIVELFNFTLSKETELDRLQSELMLLIRQQDAETCALLLDFLKLLSGLTIKKRPKPRRRK